MRFLCLHRDASITLVAELPTCADPSDLGIWRAIAISLNFAPAGSAHMKRSAEVLEQGDLWRTGARPIHQELQTLAVYGVGRLASCG
jgi:hypothetical protein